MMLQSQQQLPELDYAVLDRELDKTKTRVFLGKHAAFLGTLMCSLDFQWTKNTPTAATNGTNLLWNPYYFHFLSNRGRDSILIHELWHVALMHMLRLGDRDPRIWNQACDTVLDNMMVAEGYLVDESLFPQELFPPGSKPCTNPQYGAMSAEEIYELMTQNPPPPPPPSGGGSGGTGDLIYPGQGEGGGNLQQQGVNPHAVINNVMGALQTAKMSGAGNIPGDVEATLKKFLSPKLPWKQILANFFNDLSNQDYSWSRPNRRYSNMYLPGMIDDREGLDHLAYFLDVSGSISEGDIIRFHSEFKYVKETFQPEKMTMIQFDTRITKTDVFEKDDLFEETHVIGRGGTCLICVRDWIIEHQPTAVVIFSDLQVEPMKPLPQGVSVPIIWVALNNRSAKVPHGQIVHLNE